MALIAAIRELAEGDFCLLADCLTHRGRSCAELRSRASLCSARLKLGNWSVFAGLCAIAGWIGLLTLPQSKECSMRFLMWRLLAQLCCRGVPPSMALPPFQWTFYAACGLKQISRHDLANPSGSRAFFAPNVSRMSQPVMAAGIGGID